MRNPNFRNAKMTERRRAVMKTGCESNERTPAKLVGPRQIGQANVKPQMFSDFMLLVKAERK